MATSSLELAILGLLKEGPMHGYELRKRLTTTLGPLWTVSYGALYPCLKRLRKANLVEEASAPAPRRKLKRRADDDTAKRRNDTETKTSKSRRARKVYEITADGERFFFDQLEQGAVYDTDGFQTRFAFFRYLPQESRIGLLERRKVHLQEKLLEFKESLQSTKERIDAYTLSLTEHGMEALEQDIRWLEDLIDRERAADGRPRRA